MARLTEEQLQFIARRVAERLGQAPPSGSRAGTTPTSSPEPMAEVEPLPRGEGIFHTIDDAVEAAEEAFFRYMELSLEQRREIIAAIREDMLANAELLAREAHQETGLGRYEHKIIKNRLVTEKTPGTEDLVPIAWSGDHGLTLVERAPYGVIAAITPTTNPTSTIICNTIGMLAAGNSVVFNVHPNAKRVSCLNIQLLNRAITRAGGPPNLVTGIANPTIESAQQLMRHKKVRLLVVTGGPGVVKEAMASGKRAICAGPGNPPVVVDETANIEKAARDIVFGASLDNNIICTDEKEVFVVESVADQLLRAMQVNKAYILNPTQLRQLEQVIFTELRGPRKPGVINKQLIGKNASVILAEIGVKVDDSVPLIVAEVGIDHPLIWTEQMMPVLPVARVRNADEGIELSVKAEHGFRHTAAMHSK
ncbi:MAG: aldehyde dehydrogenase family protein, partial [Calditrichaeota bacterium]